MRKGVNSFEFIIIMSVILLMASSLLTISFKEGTDSLILSGTKSAVIKSLERKALHPVDCWCPIEAENKTGLQCYQPEIKNFTVEDKGIKQIIRLDIEPDECNISEAKIASVVGESICRVTDENMIDCGNRKYEVILE